MWHGMHGVSKGRGGGRQKVALPAAFKDPQLHQVIGGRSGWSMSMLYAGPARACTKGQASHDSVHLVHHESMPV